MYSTQHQLFKKTNKTEIAGEIFGIGLSLYSLVFDFWLNIFFIFYTLLSIALSTFCLISGIECLRKPLLGLTLTSYNQLLQLVWFTVFGFTYLFNPGLGLYFGVQLSKTFPFVYQFKLPYFQFGKANPEEINLLINIIPVIIAFSIEPIKKKIKKST